MVSMVALTSTTSNLWTTSIKRHVIPCKSLMLSTSHCYLVILTFAADARSGDPAQVPRKLHSYDIWIDDRSKWSIRKIIEMGSRLLRWEAGMKKLEEGGKVRDSMTIRPQVALSILYDRLSFAPLFTRTVSFSNSMMCLNIHLCVLERLYEAAK